MDEIQAFIFDFGGVLHQTPLTPFTLETVVQEVKVLKPLLQNLNKVYSLAIVSNSIKEVIQYVLDEAGIKHLFTTVKGGVKGKSKIPRLLKVMDELNTNQVLLLDDKEINIKDASSLGISTMLVTYDDLKQIKV